MNAIRTWQEVITMKAFYSNIEYLTGKIFTGKTMPYEELGDKTCYLATGSVSEVAASQLRGKSLLSRLLRNTERWTEEGIAKRAAAAIAAETAEATRSPKLLQRFSQAVVEMANKTKEMGAVTKRL